LAEEVTMIAEIEYHRPQTIGEALDLLAAHGPDARPLAGGTIVMVDLRENCPTGKHLIDLSCLQELHGIEKQGDFIRIGSGTTITELRTHPLIAAYAPVLPEVAGVFANPLVRNRATIGGNVADGHPAADTLPALLALDAELQLVNRKGMRWVGLEDYMADETRTLLQPGELILAVRWPVPARRSAQAYTKNALRKADAITVMSAAVLVELCESGLCQKARIALGSVAARPIRAHKAEGSLLGRTLTLESIAEAARLAAEAARPIDDIRGTAAYRRRITEVTVRRLLEKNAEALR
jgi:probable selenate reductase FAD-binding subunit